MKIKKIRMLLISILLINIGCNKEKVEENGGNRITLAADCIEASFIENYSYCVENNRIFYIKGIALDIFEYGRTIKVIEDLKGNFDGESSIFVWGSGYPSKDNYICISNERFDDIIKYQKNDTLIMLVSKKTVINDECIESIGDYMTIDCSHSILKLSNGFATGYILPNEDDTFLCKETTMSCKELSALLNSSKKTSK